MKKKILTIGIAVIIAITVITGASIAYFTDTDKATNVITSGKIDIKLDEAEVEYDEQLNIWVEKVDGERVHGNKYENVYPGAVIPKDPTVYNIGTMDAYVRVKVAFPVVSDNAQADFTAVGNLFAIDADNFVFGDPDTYNLEALFEGFDASKWDVEQTAYNMPFFGTPDTILELTFTLKDKLAKDSSVTLFEAVNVNPEIEETFGITMEVTAEAVQATTFDSAEAAFAATFDK